MEIFYFFRENIFSNLNKELIFKYSLLENKVEFYVKEINYF